MELRYKHWLVFLPVPQLGAGAIMFPACLCVGTSCDFVNKICHKLHGEFRHIYNFGALFYSMNWLDFEVKSQAHDWPDQIW